MKKWNRTPLIVSALLFAMGLWALWYIWTRDHQLTPIQIVAPLLVMAGAFLTLKAAPHRPRHDRRSIREQIEERSKIFEHIDRQNALGLRLYLQGPACMLDSRIEFFHQEKTFKVVLNGTEIGVGFIHHHTPIPYTEAFIPTREITTEEMVNTISCIVRTYGLGGERLFQRALTLHRLAPFEEPIKES